MKKIIFVAILGLFSLTQFFSQSMLDSKTYAKVMGAVFEVVVEKTDSKNVTYERELPIDRIDFTIRNDKYVPIGTAFRTNDGTFFTAAHVITLFGESVYKDYYIRDTNGEVYKIDEITAFSTDRDFISFTVENFKGKKKNGFQIAKSIEPNSQVFSVGNAHGEGIIIRDGVFTSQTYESKNGEWRWLRFSAAASPGNSGGPLIKADGTVVGIITMKSENENLNYALPIEEAISAKKNVGVFSKRFNYVIPNIFNQKFYHESKTEIKLPKKLNDLQKSLTKIHNKNIEEIIEDIRKDYSPTSPKSFDNSSGKAEFLSSTYRIDFPYVLYLGETGHWDWAKPAKLNTYRLENNGYVEFGRMMNQVFSVIKKPDDISMKDLVSNPKIYMDYLAKATNLNRTMAGEKIQITSLGEPVKTDTHKDFFGRTWLVNYFSIDFADCMVLTYALPLPSGLFVIYSIGSTRAIKSESFHDLDFLTDFVYMSYQGKLKEWKEYLELPAEYAPRSADFESSIKIERGETTFEVKTDKIELSLPQEILKVDDDTTLFISNGYTKNDGKLGIENLSMGVYTDPKSENYTSFLIRYQNKPANDALEETKNFWTQLMREISPFNGIPTDNKQFTTIQKVIFPEGTTDENKEDIDHAYIYGTIMTCKNDKDVILEFSKKAQDCFKLKEAGK